MADELGGDLFLDEEDVISTEPSLDIPANFDWIFLKNGQTLFLQVLKTVGVPESETIESNAARIMSSKCEENIKVGTDFLKQMSTSFLVCYQNVEQIKCANQKMMKLEKSFLDLFDNPVLNLKWSCLVRTCGLQTSDGTNILLNHVLQHFWSSLVLHGSHELSEQGENSNSVPINASSTEPEDIEVQSRVREEFNGGPQMYKIPVSKTDNTDVEVDKYYLLSLIERLGYDVLSRPGKFLFNAIPEVEVFLYLHNTVENIVKNQLETHVDKEILKNCLKVLNEDIQLRCRELTVL
ncbi:Hypothetical predicted protein [Paramuricea clavata]|uniref:Uncharacterized protein n=1 Tax=Paramuricea clavata TaxID=317549 RepID=A0A6S7IQM4_PARCT|nr:Hypothetical predicted protein [Paramuricea clavata]